MATNLPGFDLLYFNVIRSYTTSSDGPKTHQFVKFTYSSSSRIHMLVRALQVERGFGQQASSTFRVDTSVEHMAWSCLWTW